MDLIWESKVFDILYLEPKFWNYLLVVLDGLTFWVELVLKFKTDNVGLKQW